MESNKASGTIFYIHNTPVLYVDDPEDFGNDPVYFNPASSDSGEMKNLIDDYKNKNNLESTRLKSFYNGDAKDNTKSDVGIEVGINSKITANVSSLFDSTCGSHLESSEITQTQNTKELFLRILEKLDEYENKIEVLNDNFIKEKTENLMMKNEINNLKIDNNKLNSELTNLNEEIYYIDCKVIENNQYARRESVIISGIPEYIDQNNLEENVLHILRSIGLTSLSSYNISACHRLMKKNKDRHPAQTIVRFTNRKIVNYCLNNRDKLFQQRNYLKMNLRFYESLCASNKKVYDKCFDLKKYGLITDFYIRNGFVKIVKNDNRIIKIQHPDDLYFYFKEYYECNDLYEVSS